jgi:HAD superfamily hydrolase (TIGR01509 family)
VTAAAAPLPAAVLFDMDGLLVATEATWFATESAIMAGLGVAWGEEHQAALVGGPLRNSVEYMLRVAGDPDDLPVEAFEEALLAGMVTRLRSAPVEWMPGARELLAEVEAAGVPAALVSSSLRIVVDAVLDSVGHEHFATTVSADDVARTKPYPDPYLAAARTLGVDPRDCVVLEDSATGAASGLAAGCAVVAVPTVGGVDLGEVDAVVGSLAEVDMARLGDLVRARRDRPAQPVSR